MRRALLALSAAVVLPLAGCHSAYIEATIRNQTSETIDVVEVDYPTASFGTNQLGPNRVYHYRFKVLGQGPTKILWTDAHHVDHTGDGPSLGEHDEGQMTVTISAAQPSWSLNLVNRKTN